MATLIRFFFICWIVSSAGATESAPAVRDSLLPDTTWSVQLDDTSASRNPSTVSNWLFPLTVIGATAGVFLVLFTARSK